MHAECVLKVGVIGINHKIANLIFREAVARGASTLAGEKALFFPHAVLLLSTCNRTEIYFAGKDLALIHSDLLEWLRGHIREDFEYRLYSYFGFDCFVHLARVVTGLDSAIVAETEIQAQVKTAYGLACQFSKLPSCMHYIFQKALKIGKYVRNAAKIERGPSLYQAIWQLASDHLPSFEQARILLVGHSKINRGMAHFLWQRKRANLTFITHHPQALFEGCKSLGYEAVDDWPDYDWIICASSHDRYLIQGTGKGCHAIFDLSVPRNVDPKVGKQGGIYLYNIEQINAWIQATKSKQTGQIADAMALVGSETARLTRLYRQKQILVS